ncbi:MAG: hypothetical protein AAF367_00880 [Pseudomonadota bacterium]
MSSASPRLISVVHLPASIPKVQGAEEDSALKSLSPPISTASPGVTRQFPGTRTFPAVIEIFE